jgi:hypothetical protein
MDMFSFSEHLLAAGIVLLQLLPTPTAGSPEFPAR